MERPSWVTRRANSRTAREQQWVVAHGDSADYASGQLFSSFGNRVPSTSTSNHSVSTRSNSTSNVAAGAQCAQEHVWQFPDLSQCIPNQQTGRQRAAHPSASSQSVSAPRSAVGVDLPDSTTNSAAAATALPRRERKPIPIVNPETGQSLNMAEIERERLAREERTQQVAALTIGCESGLEQGANASSTVAAPFPRSTTLSRTVTPGEAQAAVRDTSQPYPRPQTPRAGASYSQSHAFAYERNELPESLGAESEFGNEILESINWLELNSLLDPSPLFGRMQSRSSMSLFADAVASHRARSPIPALLRRFVLSDAADVSSDEEYDSDAEYEYGDDDSESFTYSSGSTHPVSASATNASSPQQGMAEFKRKCRSFRQRLEELYPRSPARTALQLRRSDLFQNAFTAIMQQHTVASLRAQLVVHLDGESGIDSGGLLREMLALVSEQLFNPDYGLFQYSALDRHTVQINAHSYLAAGPDHLEVFRFAGRLMGLAVYHNQVLCVSFSPLFCRTMLGKQMTLDDVKSFDAEYHRSLRFIMDSDPSTLMLTFSVTEDQLGERVEVDLIPNGRRIAVTEINKADYVKAIIQHKFVGGIKEQMRELLKGFNDFVPTTLLSTFLESELCLLFGGCAKIEVEDWRCNTRYSGGYHPGHKVIVYFWRAVTSYSADQRAQLLRFATGTSRLPAAGFADLRGFDCPQRFTVERSGSIRGLPRAHTCFNRLDLPPYKTYEDLRHKLLYAVQNANVFDGVD